MRCDDLTRELACPTGALSSAEMAGHLAKCPRCAEWSRQADQLDQIWEATRPSLPTPAMMDALWASASVSLEAQPVPSPLRLEGLTVAPRRSWIKPALLLAQAAAILAATGIFLARQGAFQPIQIAQNEVTPIDPGRTNPLIQIAPNTIVFEEIPSKSGILLVNDDEELIVSIAADQASRKVAKVDRRKDDRLEQSTSIPSGTSFEMMGAVESMVEPPVVASVQ